MMGVVLSETGYESDFTGLFWAFHPEGKLFAEGHDNFGKLPPIHAERIHTSQVKHDVNFSFRATA
ncbi:MAG: hypothetical protein AAF718_00265 [Pseudomonadota bacterium]